MPNARFRRMFLCRSRHTATIFFRQAMVDTPVTTAKARKIKLVQATGLPPEYEDGVPPRTGYNDEVIEELRKKAIELAAQGEDVDPTPIPEGTYKTDKEKLGIAVHKYTPTAAKKEPGVHRLH